MEVPLVRVLDDEGQVVPGACLPEISDSDLRRIYVSMLHVRLLDERMMRLQRQGRVGFCLAATGEEATHIGPVFPLRDSDWIHPSYREIGAALYRGYPLRTFMCQMFGNADDPLLGRQMPVHHSIKSLNYVSISSPIGTQIVHATGVAMAAKRMGKDDVALAYFGDGATSSDQFHVGLNLAAVDRAPVIFFCRNNGWAISTPRARQSASATIAQKAVAYGMPGVMADGNDVLALIQVTRQAIARARQGEGPTLIEGVTYRRAGHSSSDDPSGYRDEEEAKRWTGRDPIVRFGRFLRAHNLWSDGDEDEASTAFVAKFQETLAQVDQIAPRPPMDSMFQDVFAQRPWHLREQEEDLLAPHEHHATRK